MNEERSAEGLPPLKIEVHLNASAQAHSDWMAETETLSHTGEDGSDATDRIEDSGFPLTGSWTTAENLAYTSLEGGLDAGEADRMHAGLMDSAEHRANIMNPDLTYVGVGLSIGNITLGSDRYEVAFLTENFADTEGEVLVQEEVDGETVVQPYQDDEPVDDPQFSETSPPEDPRDPDADEERDDERDDDSSSGSGCFVATAAYGDRLHPEVVALRRYRDRILARNAVGRAFIRVYGALGPWLARLVTHDRASGRAARALIAPLARAAGRRIRRRR